MKIVEAVFEKTKFSNFFPNVNYPTFSGQIETNRKNKNKEKRGQEIFARGLQISNFNQIGQLVQALRYVTGGKLKTIFLV